MNKVIVENIIKNLDYNDIIMCRLALKHIIQCEDNYSLEIDYRKTFEKFGGSL